MKNTIKTTAVLILAGTTVKGDVEVYYPTGKPYSHYIANKQELEKVYNLDGGYYQKQKASEARKQQILANISKTRSEIRAMVSDWKKKKLAADIDEDTWTNIYADRLMNRIFTN